MIWILGGVAVLGLGAFAYVVFMAELFKNGDE